MNKRASEAIALELVLIIASVFIFSAILIFVSKATTSASYYEEIYAKKIGLAIEASPPGSVLKFDISEPYKISKANKFFGNSFEEGFRREFFYFDSSDYAVRIKLSESGGYVFKTMSKKIVTIYSFNINADSKVLIVELGGKNE